MDTNGRFPSTRSGADLHERRFREVSQELDAALWNLLLRPTTSTLGVLQLGATIELMPNVYVQAVRLMHKHPYDRYIRLWCVVPTESGELDERTLLCFYTQGFPDPQFTQARPGMDMNLAWWDAVRIRLAEVASELGMQAELEEPENVPPGLPRPPGGPAPANAYAMMPPAPARHATPSPHTPAQDGRHAQILASQTMALFEDVKRTRDEALARRDEIDQQLAKLYFTAYPYMRQALKHLTEVDLGEQIARWAREGCPAPQSEAKDKDSPDANQEQAPMAEMAESASGVEGAWALALELEGTQSLIRERTRVLGQLCELSGGHEPSQRRDGATGRLQTVCERCAMQLFQRDPDVRDGWIN
jgi:hypothetical protein